MIERLIQHKRLILHYYIVIFFIGLLLWHSTSRDEVIDGEITLILAVYILLFPVVILYTRKYALHIFLFILAFITGFYSFYHYSVEPHSFLNALYFTFQLFLLVMTDVFTADGSSMVSYPLVVEISRWSAALYTISTLFIAIYRTLEMSILLVYYQIVGNHYIVFGYHENSFHLLKDLRKHKKRVILVDENISNEEIDMLEDLKIAVIRPHDNEGNIYTKCGLDRARNIILFYEKDMDNLNELMEIDDYLGKISKHHASLSLFIHLKKIQSRKLFTELEEVRSSKDRSYDIQIINIYDQFAHHLFTKYPIYNKKNIGNSPHLLIIGFGSMGQYTALQAINEAGRIANGKIHITALDKHMDRIIPEWKRQNPNIADKATISLQTFDIESQTVESIIGNQTIAITHIYICLPEDYLDVLASIELSTQFPTIPIYIEFPKNSMAEKWIQSEVSGTRLIYSAGTYKDILTEDRLLKK